MVGHWGLQFEVAPSGGAEPFEAFIVDRVAG
jgi:hypothetical protein